MGIANYNYVFNFFLRHVQNVRDVTAQDHKRLDFGACKLIVRWVYRCIRIRQHRQGKTSNSTLILEPVSSSRDGSTDGYEPGSIGRGRPFESPSSLSVKGRRDGTMTERDFEGKIKAALLYLLSLEMENGEKNCCEEFLSRFLDEVTF